MHLITDDDVRRLITMRDAINELRLALLEHGRGHARIQPRVKTKVGNITLSTMGAILPDAGVCGAKVYSTHAGKFDFVIPLFSNDDGSLLSIVHGDALTEYRTAAVTRVASEVFARADARVLAVFGTGLQAKAHIRAIVADSSIERVLIVGIERVAQTLEEMQICFPDKRFEASDAQAAVSVADIIVTATRSTTPLFDGAQVKPGAFVAAIGSSKPDARELDDTVLARAGRIVVESLEQARLEAGDLLMAQPGIVNWDHVIELGHAVFNGTVPSFAEDTTVFKSLGFGLADVALAQLVTQRVMGERLQ
ncbi:ornithine cyclodeaminase [Paraburkholderia sp. BL6669N2]|uniref:ornithine cyclodeaminase family protein n=1 Tax=Paraburkholderia sp. BL6669N2 TaxID=1938807 RepID=UPI000E22A025|nr:ornithine cyclodeaminase family protein [Paraburkholderia sp. BL6669N2]REG45522.1 ornithine cyclodeaminase [Paraburkholderia sp. BL6669N2]